MNIAIIGETGGLGSGLALRWAKAGHKVTMGSRDGARAASFAAELAAKVGAEISGDKNANAAQNCDLAVMAVPYASHAATLGSIKA